MRSGRRTVTEPSCVEVEQRVAALFKKLLEPLFGAATGLIHTQPDEACHANRHVGQEQIVQR